jgi:hypothetical protein
MVVKLHISQDWLCITISFNVGTMDIVVGVLKSRIAAVEAAQRILRAVVLVVPVAALAVMCHLAAGVGAAGR